MIRKITVSVSSLFQSLTKELRYFSFFFWSYNKKKVLSASSEFEKAKNRLVRLIMMKRGRYTRPFLHVTTMAVLGLGVLIAPFLAETYPVLNQKSTVLGVTTATEKQSIEVGDNVFSTQITPNFRNKVVTYTVEKGDTLSTIAKKFDISTETVKWANDLTSDNVTVGDELKILPVTGIQHKVNKGDTVQTIATKYDSEAQKIVDFPFNDFANPETFSLVEGQMLIVPDGVKPSEKPRTVPRQTYLATAPVGQVSGGGFAWPLRGGISQFASWYHMALDITNPVGTPIYAAQNGTVIQVSVGSYDGGYGNNIWIDNGAGVASHYAHMQSVNVSSGQQVSAGKTIVGWVGLTGRTTGAHLHFEIRQNGSLVNPLSYLP